MDEASITRSIVETFEGVDVVVASQESGAPEVAWGDTFFFCEPDRNVDPAHRWPFATIVTQDYGDFDCASNLNRPGIFRLNIRVSKETYRSLFGEPPARAGDNGVVETGHDFTTLDRLLPHPVYAPMSWVCVLNPSEETFQTVSSLLADAYDLAVQRHARRERTSQS